MGNVRTIRQDNNIHNMHFELIGNSNNNRKREEKKREKYTYIEWKHNKRERQMI